MVIIESNLFLDSNKIANISKVEGCKHFEGKRAQIEREESSAFSVGMKQACSQPLIC